MESNVRSYCRAFPAMFSKASDCFLWDRNHKRYLDFLAGCGSLNYGHNHPALKSELVRYVAEDGITMSIDLVTQAKKAFMDAFTQIVLEPRGLEYRYQFSGPTGANAVEAAIKLARKVTRRQNIVAFTNGFHGCTLGALALTGSAHHRGTSLPLLAQVTHMPYDGYLGPTVDTADMLDKLLGDPSSGIDAPAAIIFEPIQGEGGLNHCSRKWAQKIARIAKRHGALLIADEIQSGCGRSGSFFAFEALGIKPDIVCLAKAISGYGLPMSLVLVKPEYDVWLPGEHNGTFRGNNLAFVTGKAALEQFWIKKTFRNEVRNKSEHILAWATDLAARYPGQITPKGSGMLSGIEFASPEAARTVQQGCFTDALIIELCGPNDEVLKLLPPLNISEQNLANGLDIISRNIAKTLTDSDSEEQEFIYG